MWRRAAAQLLDKEKGLENLQRWRQRPRPVGMKVEPVTLKTTSHDHYVRGVTLRNHILFWRLGASGRGFTSPLLSQPQFQGCSRQEEENRGVRAAGPTPALTRTKTSCSPQPEVVCLQTTVFALATVLCLPGQQRLSVCLPRPPPRLHLWPPPGPSWCKFPRSSQRLSTDAVSRPVEWSVAV